MPGAVRSGYSNRCHKHPRATKMRESSWRKGYHGMSVGKSVRAELKREARKYRKRRMKEEFMTGGRGKTKGLDAVLGALRWVVARLRSFVV